MEQVLVFGIGGHANVVIDVIEKEGRYSVSGVIDHRHQPFKSMAPFLGNYAHLGTDNDIGRLGIQHGIVAVGDNWIRKKIVTKILSLLPEFKFITAIHPSAQIARGVEMSPGTVIMAGACINADTRIGAHCIINTRASIDHECVIEDFASIAPGVTIGGNVRVGYGSAVGLGASVIHKVSIGARSLIGAGAVVVKDLPENVVAYGVPCRVIRERK
jgi:sugar O-acyltransferase (sialic acid O-acetyltransferase NeuD family)